MKEKYAYSPHTRTQLLLDSMMLVEKMKQRPDYSPERFLELLEREAGLQEKALRHSSSERRLQILRELAVYGLKNEAQRSTEEAAEILGYRSLVRVRMINATIRAAYERYSEEVKKMMTPPAAIPPSESELAERRFQELLCTRLKREFPALAQFSHLPLDEIARNFGLAPLYTVSPKTLRAALELYFS